MKAFLHRRTGRAALTVVLLLATQFAFAGQLCRAVTVGGVPDGRPAHVLAQCAHGQGGHGPAGAADSHLCCDGVAMPASTCVIALGDLSLAALTPGGAPQSDLAPPLRDHAIAAIIGAPSASVPRPTTAVGPTLPAYIVFRRFLS